MRDTKSGQAPKETTVQLWVDTGTGFELATEKQIVAAAEKIVTEPMLRGAALCSPGEASRIAELRLAMEESEVFSVMFLDTRHRLIAFEDMFFGTIDGATVHPREVVKAALVHNAAAVILTHNHPSGVTEPSQADRLITHRLRDALALIDVRVLDHLIVGRGGITASLAARGWI